jgi:hypothetical protein
MPAANNRFITGAIPNACGGWNKYRSMMQSVGEQRRKLMHYLTRKEIKMAA